MAANLSQIPWLYILINLLVALTMKCVLNIFYARPNNGWLIHTVIAGCLVVKICPSRRPFLFRGVYKEMFLTFRLHVWLYIYIYIYMVEYGWVLD